MDNNFENTLIESIKDAIEEQINNEYTEFKLMYLDNLDYRLEKRRNEVVKSILNTIDIKFKNEFIDCPNLQINIIKNEKENDLWKID